MTSQDRAPLECVAFMLVKDNHVMAEKRKLTKTLVPGAVALPGGHMEDDEHPEDALQRELLEELGILARRVVYVCTLLHRAEEFRKIHYFAVENWEGRFSIAKLKPCCGFPSTSCTHSIWRLTG